MNRNKIIIDDGFCPELVEGAHFDGIFEIPHVPGPKEIIIPEGMIPFTNGNTVFPRKNSWFSMNTILNSEI